MIVTLTRTQATAGLFFILQVLILGLGSTSPERSATSIAAHVLDVLAAAAVALLTHFEHVKSIRPSFLISFYLAITALLDTARVRTAWLLPSNSAAAATLTVSLAVKILLVGLETTEKRKWLSVPEKGISLESTSGPFNRGFFVWLNGLLRRGYSSLLTPDALPINHERLKSAALAERFQYAWDHGKAFSPPHRFYSLPSTGGLYFDTANTAGGRPVSPSPNVLCSQARPQVRPFLGNNQVP